MIIRVFAAVTVVVMVAGFAIAKSQRADEKDTERYIIQSEGQWAESLATGNTAIVQKILAEDFMGIEPDGSFYDKRKELANTPEAPKEFASNHVNEVKVRFYGDAAIAQGSESWVRRSGTPKRGRFVWTDTWIKRNGQWQVVAAVDVAVPETEK